MGENTVKRAALVGMVCGIVLLVISLHNLYDAAVELRDLRADKRNHVQQEQTWEVFCWDKELKQHSLRYVSHDKLSYEMESEMCEALVK